MDDIQKAKEKLDYDLRLWIAELQRGKDLEAKAKTHKQRSNARKVIVDARWGISQTEHRLERVKMMKKELAEVMSH